MIHNQNAAISVQETAAFFVSVFGGYATPRKHTVFSRLALNSSYQPISGFRERKMRKNPFVSWGRIALRRRGIM